jgi:hypothetical protein
MCCLGGGPGFLPKRHFLGWGCLFFQTFDSGQGLNGIFPAQLFIGLEINTDAGSFRFTEQGAEIVRSKMNTARARGLAVGHARQGTGDGNGDTAGSAAGTTFHTLHITEN